MKVLVTGGFGNIGVTTVDECLGRGHTVTVFDVRNRRTEKLARHYRGKGVRVFLGDVRRPADLQPAVAGQDAVIHLAAILPPTAEESPELCLAVNVGGTWNLLNAMESVGAPGASLVLVSSASVMGPTQGRNPPVRPTDPPVGTDVYSRSKIEAEELVSSSSVRYCILRLAAVMPTRPPSWSSRNSAGILFEMPLGARCEIVLDLDVAFALATAAENLAGSATMAGKRAFIAGGKAGECQLTTGALAAGLFEAMGLNPPDRSLYSSDPDSYYLDWYDTDEVEGILHYQRHTFDEWKVIIARRFCAIRVFLKLLGPILMPIIQHRSTKIRRK